MRAAAPVVVVGAGIGGLCAAVVLAAAGQEVVVIEAQDGPGGKAGVEVIDGVEVDTGPSVLTLPDAFAGVFEAAGERMEAHVTLRALDPGFLYRWPDGAALTVHHRLEDTLSSVERTFGGPARRELEAFMAYAREIWAASHRYFVTGPLPPWTTLLTPSAWGAFTRIDPLSSFAGAIQKRVRTPHLRDLLLRYATYNGSDARRAPAALNCIAHVELALGGFGVEGGIAALVRALVTLAERRGVAFHYRQPVTQIEVSRGAVTAVSGEGWRQEASAVVANAEARLVLQQLLPPAARPRASTEGAPSTSGWTAVLRAAPLPHPRAPHTVLFPSRYLAEFEDLFDHHRPPVEPTVYLCAQSHAHGRPGWPGAEPVFVMANAPACPPNTDPSASPDTLWGPLAEATLARLYAAGLATPSDRVVWSRTPAGLARRFPGSHGALYGLASNTPMAAFQRPAARVAGVGGLYLASGSAHPGGGLPLCAWSGRIAAQALLQDRA